MTKARSNENVSASRLMARGESFVASTGIAIVAVILMVAGASTWWAMEAQTKAARGEAEGRARQLAALLATSVETLLVDVQVSAARRLVLEAGAGEGVVSAQFRLPDGQVVAHSDPSKITRIELPETWTGEVVAAVDRLTEQGMIRIVEPIVIGTRGAAAIEVEHVLPSRASAASSMQLGSLTIAGVGLGLILLVYRRMRSRLGALSAIREALAALSAGESQREALEISERLGTEAAGWNKLLAEREVLQRKRVEEKLAETASASDSAGAQIADDLPHGVLAIDAAGKVCYANGAAALLLQTPREQVLGAGLVQLLGAQDAGVLAGAGGTRQRAVVERVLTSEDGPSATLRLTARSVRHGHAGGLTVVIEDVTQQRMAEQSRKIFVDQATHELRTPLTNIRLYTEQAIEDGDTDPASLAAALNVISSETRRLERIVQDMLSVSEIEAGSLSLRLDDVRPEELFGELAKDYKRQAEEKQISLSFDLAPKFDVLHADRDKLLLALHNLIGNAIKYTPQGGAVCVRAAGDEAGTLRVDVSDTGIGISEEDQVRVFERFYRAKDKRIAHVTGTGIGLTLARDVVRLHGGEITVESELNKGTTFTLTLPGRGVPTAQVQAAARAA